MSYIPTQNVVSFYYKTSRYTRKHLFSLLPASRIFFCIFFPFLMRRKSSQHRHYHTDIPVCSCFRLYLSLPITAGILAASVTMKYSIIFHSTPPYCIPQCCFYQFGIYFLTEGISYDFPVIQIHDHCKINPSCTGPDVCYITCP